MEMINQKPIVDQCIGCEHISGGFCRRYAMPHAQWTRSGGCAMRTHNLTKQVETAGISLPPKKARRR